MSVFEDLERTASKPHGEAQSLPFSAYRDPGLFAAEIERIWHTDWVFVCAEQELANPGDYYACRLGDEPIAVLRGADGTVRALSNICRHRGTQLLDDGFGQIDKLIICPYHAWAYDDGGKLKAAPFAKAIPVEPGEHCLPNFAVSEWSGLLFVHLGDAPTPLNERLHNIDEYLTAFDISRFTAVTSGPIEVWQANWKLIMENAMESYHLFKVHSATLEVVTPTRGAYYVAGGPEWSVTGGKSESPTGWLGRLTARRYPEAYDHYLLVSLPPSFVGILSYDSFGWLSMHPLNATTTVIRSGAITNNPSTQDSAEARAFTSAFFAEDKHICERVQQSMGAVKSRGGQLVDMERIVVDFHQYVANRLFSTRPNTQCWDGH